MTSKTERVAEQPPESGSNPENQAVNEKAADASTPEKKEEAVEKKDHGTTSKEEIAKAQEAVQAVEAEMPKLQAEADKLQGPAKAEAEKKLGFFASMLKRGKDAAAGKKSDAKAVAGAGIAIGGGIMGGVIKLIGGVFTVAGYAMAGFDILMDKATKILGSGKK